VCFSDPAFAAACRRVSDHCPQTRAAKAQSVLNWHTWDTIAERITTIIAVAAGADAEEPALPAPS